MANLYLRSTDGNDTDGGATWDLAKATIMQMVAIDAVGDNLYVSQAHAESTAAIVNVALAGTLAIPTKMLCVNDAVEPPTTLATTGSITTTGANNIQFTGNMYVYGLTFNAGNGASTAQINPCSQVGTTEAQTFEQCNFVLPNTSATSNILIGHLTASVPHKCIWKNCRVKFANASQRVQVSGADFTWRGGSAQAGTTTPTNGLILNAGTGRSGNVLVEGVDLSNFASTLALVSNLSMPGRVMFRNCKLPASWTGGLFNAAPTLAGIRAELHNCDSGDTNYRLHVEDFAGSIKHETTIVRSGGASDGTTAYSLKMTSSALAHFAYPLESVELPARSNDTIGSPITVKVDVIHDSATNLKDDEIWLEVQYLGTSGFPLSSIASDAKADILAAAADQDASSATWTTTGMTAPNKQTLSVTFTPQKKGYLLPKVMLGKASKTVFVDAKLQVS